LMIFDLNLMAWAPALALAADPDGDATTAASPITPKPRHRLKNAPKADTVGGKPVASSGANIHNRGTDTGDPDTPGMSDSLGSNSPGSPNMGAPDHVPGTTGTSGQ